MDKMRLRDALLDFFFPCGECLSCGSMAKQPRNSSFVLYFSIGLPKSLIFPRYGRQMPQMALSVVDLPAPLPPRMAEISPAGISVDTPRRMSRPSFSYRNHSSFRLSAGSSTSAGALAGSALIFGAAGNSPLSQFRPCRTVSGLSPVQPAP